MPRTVGYTGEQKIRHQQELLAHRCKVLLYDRGITMTKVAEYVGITPQALHWQFRNNRVTTDVLIAVISLTNADAETCEKLIKI